MRNFQNKNWEYSIRQFDLLSRKKEWSIRFRMEYMHQISVQYSAYWRFRIFISNLLGILNLFRFSLIKQRKPVEISECSFIIPFATSTGYLLHLQPVARELIRRGESVILLCSTREYEILKAKLGPDLAARLYVYESLSDRKTYIGRAFHSLAALFFAVPHVIWFSMQPVKYALHTSSMFGRYAFTQYFLAGFLKRSLSSRQVIISTSDHWLYESLFFTIGRRQGARTYSLQHGMVEDMAYPMFSQYFVTWGRQDYLKLTEELGASPGEVLTGGSPYFDKLYADVLQQSPPEGAYSRPYITYLSEPLVKDGYLTQEEYASVVNRFYSLQSLAEKYGKRLLIKLHPRGKEHVYTDRPDGVELIREGLFDVLRESAIAVTYDSTAIFESTMFSVPCVQSILPSSSRQMIYAGTGLCLLSRSQDELQEHIQRLLHDRNIYNTTVENAHRALGEYFGPLSGSLDKTINLLTDPFRQEARKT